MSEKEDALEDMRYGLKSLQEKLEIKQEEKVLKIAEIKLVSRKIRYAEYEMRRFNAVAHHAGKASDSQNADRKLAAIYELKYYEEKQLRDKLVAYQEYLQIACGLINSIQERYRAEKRYIRQAIELAREINEE